MIEAVLSLSILKVPFGIRTYLNIIPILFGLYYFIRKRQISLDFLPLVLICLLNGALLLYQKDWAGIARIGQVFCMVGFVHFLKTWLTDKKLIRIAKYSILLSTVALLIEIIFIKTHIPKSILGINLLRFNGPVGEPNYSGLMLAAFSNILLFFGHYFYFALGLGLSILCASRTGLLCIFFFSFFYLLLKKRKIILHKFSLGLLIFFSLTPVWVFLVHRFMPDSMVAWIETVSSARFYLLVGYLDMGLDNILGVGYFNGWQNIEFYLAPYRKIIESILVYLPNEQHNIFMQCFSEFGIIGYLLFIWQLFNIFRFKLSENDKPVIFLFSSFFVALSLLNGLNEFVFYLIIGLIWSKDTRDTTRGASRPIPKSRKL